MSLDGAWSAYIFRDGKASVRAKDLVNQLIEQLASVDDSSYETRRTATIDLLLRAGELEGALLDAGSAEDGLIATITDTLAQSLVTDHSVPAPELAQRVRILQVPEFIAITPPEGFAYYSLHPLDFADLTRTIVTHSRFVAVIGIRSIGTTLSAVVQAALRQQDIHVERITVRPVGHPYDRRTEFASGQLRWIAAMLSCRADFLVVDEGPGMSGSSFLSVGDALLAAGVPRSSIAFLCSRDAQSSWLTAPNAAERWPAFRSYCTRPTSYLPKHAEVFVAGGIWRAHVYSDQQQWPASWLQMERLKFFSAEGDFIFKFEGYGRFGRAVHERSVRVSDAGFGPAPLGFEEGFGIYPRLRGRVLSSSDATPAVLQRIACYCAFRAQAMQTDLPTNVHLGTMLCFNVKEEFGVELTLGAAELRVARPVVADGRSTPHKWIDTDGALMKVDSAIHGDDHFFPGPTDIAWDIAGVIVEWDLDAEAARSFLDFYYRASGDDAHARLPNYLLAYSIFRMAYCKMASVSMQGSEEEARLVRDYHRYRSLSQRYLRETAERSAASEVVLKSTTAELPTA
jgi:hypothetical protein